jgi:hypothetical protein
MKSVTHATRAAAVGLGVLFLATAPVMAGDFVSQTSPVLAYVGPGAGLGFIGSLLAILAVVFLGLVGLVAYPLKLILRMRRSRPGGAHAESHRHDCTTG